MKVTCTKRGSEKLVRKEVFEIRVAKVMAAKSLDHDAAVIELNATYECRDCRPKAVKPVKAVEIPKAAKPKKAKKAKRPATVEALQANMPTETV